MIALLVAFILKRQRSTNERKQIEGLSDRQIEEHSRMETTSEIAFMFLTPYVSYLIAEGL